MTLRLPADPATPLADEPTIAESGRPVVVLADATTKLEQRIIEAWAERQPETASITDVIAIRPSRRRNLSQRTDPRLHARLDRGDDPWVVPARIAWLPNERNGRRSVSLIDILKLGDPRDPDPVREHVILSKFPHRVRIVTGAGASASELHAAHDASVEASTFNDFVTRRAHRALERAERQLRGNRYKVPKFLHEEILSRSEFRDGVMRLASEIGLPPELALARSRYYLREIAASHKPFVIDLLANFIHWVYSQGYGEIKYDSDHLSQIAELGQQYPIAFLPSHRSNLDRLTLQFLLWENDMPPNHTAAGINMNFFPVGPLIRNTGAFFIRRSFKDNELYKYVLRAYLDYLVENRFPLEWYTEGGRSRSGKLLPPKMGMLSWVSESVMRNKAEDMYLIPTSIAYDQIMDVSDYATEATGGAKDKETASWAVAKIMSLRARYGNIHVRFAEPVSVRKEIGADGIDEDHLDLQKLAFEVMYRISQVTPITPTAVVSIAILAARTEAVDAAQLTDAAQRVTRAIARSDVPTTEPIHFEDDSVTADILQQLSDHGSLTIDTSTPVRTFRLTPKQAIEAAYYRNTVVHFFVPGAIAEVALLQSDPAAGVEGFWAEVDQLRDLLKFEFFFADKTRFRRDIIEEMDAIDKNWRTRLSEDRESLLLESDLLRAHWALLPFLEAYLIVATQIATHGYDGDRKQFVSDCLQTGTEWLADGRVSAGESVAKPLFGSALDLALNRRIPDGSVEDRAAFAESVADVVAVAKRVGTLAGGASRLT
ncbi:MAG: 1-acyl-sn-glycerol-3-phosphate acyltransferase [Acidimicrobiia bacterium]|nr:1-acyl-sn-glycerol-3-phosphate acyltransferase [Acidimicrobiia bacterium]